MNQKNRWIILFFCGVLIFSWFVNVSDPKTLHFVCLFFTIFKINFSPRRIREQMILKNKAICKMLHNITLKIQNKTIIQQKNI